jgi:hypothetical protein
VQGASIHCGESPFGSNGLSHVLAEVDWREPRADALRITQAESPFGYHPARKVLNIPVLDILMCPNSIVHFNDLNFTYMMIRFARICCVLATDLRCRR